MGPQNKLAEQESFSRKETGLWRCVFLIENAVPDNFVSKGNCPIQEILATLFEKEQGPKQINKLI